MMLKLKKGQQKCSQGVNRKLILPLILILMAGDMTTIYPLMDSMFYQSRILSLMITVIVGLVLEGVPYVAGHFIMRKNKDVKTMVTLAVLGAAFFTTFLGVFFLRMNSQDLQYQAMGADLSISSEIGEEKEVVFTPTEGQKSMTLLLSVLPLCTSVLALGISCAYTPQELEEEHNALAVIQMEELLANMDAVENEIREEGERDLDAYDNALYQTRMEDLENLARIEKLEARRLLALKLGTPEAVSHLLEGGTKV
jgi:hypothetical protein